MKEQTSKGDQNVKKLTTYRSKCQSGLDVMIFSEHSLCGIETILFFLADKSVQLFYFTS